LRAKRSNPAFLYTTKLGCFAATGGRGLRSAGTLFPVGGVPVTFFA
jgi:hypothetical protein